MHRAVDMVQVAGLVLSPFSATAGMNAKRERSHLARLAAEIDLFEQLIIALFVGPVTIAFATIGGSGMERKDEERPCKLCRDQDDERG